MKIKICEKAYLFVLKQGFKENYEDKYMYFLSLLSKSENYRNLTSKYLRKTFGKNKQYLNYSTIIKYLIREGVISCDNYYIEGEKSLGYKLTPEYYSKNKVEFLLKNIRLIKKIEIAGWKLFDRLPDYVKQQKFNQERLYIDGVKANTKFVRRTATGRVTNFLTNNKKIIRNYLTVDGKHNLCEIDFKNFQPYILALEIAKSLKIKSIDEYEIPMDFRNYFLLCSEGKLYNYLMEKYGSNKIDREKIKKKLLNSYLFNSKKKVINNSKIGILFNKEFPTVHAFILNNFINKNISLASLLQVREAEIIIDNITKALFEQNLYYLTIHDSIICLENNKDCVIIIIDNIMSNYVLNCKYVVKEWKILNDDIGIPLDEFDKLVDKDTEKLGQEEGFYNGALFSGGYTYGNIVKCKQGANKNVVVAESKKEIILNAAREIKEKRQPITIYMLHKLTGINKATIRKYIKTVKEMLN